MDSALRLKLAGNGLFRHLDVEALEYLLDDCARLALAVGDTLLDPGRDNENLYVVLAGELRVYLSASDLPAHTVLGVGECVGEMSLIDGQGLSALVIAASAAELLVIPNPPSGP